MEQMKQKNSWADLLDEEECLGCRIIYSIFSNFPPMPSARAYNVETGEFFPFDRMRSLPNGYEMAKALGIAWTCNCRGRRRAQLPAGADVLGSPYGNSPRKPQNLGDAQSFEYTSDVMSDDVWELAASDRGSMYACDIIHDSQFEPGTSAMARTCSTPRAHKPRARCYLELRPRLQITTRQPMDWTPPKPPTE